MQLLMKPTRARDVISMSGNSSPGLVPAKRRYIYEDLARLSAHFDIPFVMPQDARHVIYDKGSTFALGVIHALETGFPDYVERVSREIFRRVWVTDADIASRESLNKILLAVDLPVQSITAILDQAASVESKERITKEAGEAVERGLFGVPSIIYKTEENSHLLFGSDRICFLAYHLGHTWPPRRD